MLDFLLASGNAPFTTALALVIVIGLFEGVGTLVGAGVGHLLDPLIPDFDVNPDLEVADVGSNNALSRLLGWLRVGKVPVLMLLVILLIAFGCTGLLLNFISVGAVGILLPGLVSVPIAFLGALPATRIGAKALEAVLPKDESTSVSLDSLIGREAVITLGTASPDQSAEARVRDQFGNNHYIMVLAEAGHEPLSAHQPLLLVRRSGNEFFAIKAEDAALK